MGALDNMSATIGFFFLYMCDHKVIMQISELVVETPQVFLSSAVVQMAYGLFEHEIV